MKKLFLILLVFLIFSNCGYTPIYSEKNFNFNLNKITKKENTRLNSRVVKNLKSFSNKDNKNKIDIEIDTKRTIVIIARDSKGNPSRYEMTVTISIDMIHRGNKTKQRKFSSNFNYNTNTNKFELSQYEKEIEELLIQKIVEDCIIYLSKIKK